MLKDDRKKQYQKDYMKEYQRKRRGLNKEEPGSKQIEGLVVGSKQVTPDILDKLTDPVWRSRLERICLAFKGSPYAQEVRVGVNGPDLATVSELLEVTEGVKAAAKVTGVPAEARVLPQFTIDRVKAVLVNRALKGLHDDSSDRWERAVGYYHWELAGRPVYG